MYHSETDKGNRKTLKIFLAFLFLFAACVMVTSSTHTVYAAKAGFVKIKGKTYYRKSDGTYVKGWLTLKKKKYYFNTKTGVMVTGWLTDSKTGRKRYFYKSGKMLTGWTKNLRYFNPSTGYMTTGWLTLNGKKYYFNPRNGVAMTGWVKNPSGKYRYFGKTGIMLTGWTSSLRYFDLSSGIMAVGWMTISDQKYYFNTDGKAQTGWLTLNDKKYYFSSQGILHTGWTKIDSKWYYFDPDEGSMLMDTIVDNIKIGSDGVADTDTTTDKLLTSWVNSAKILILSGHGQGDPGASAKIGKTYYEEYLLTREFAKLIYADLSAKKLRVTLYDQNYDFYQVNAGKKEGPVPNLKDYDYVLEIHFNATDTNQDLKGDGKYMGCGMMINSAKKKYTLDKQIIQAIYKTGFKIWGTDGIHKSSGLLNAKTCQSKGVSYGLLETAFIDDKDDMTFYQKNKVKMAKAVADTIENYYMK